MTRQDFVHEDYERVYLTDIIYLEEAHQEMIEEWQKEEQKLPAKIEVIVEEVKKEEVEDDYIKL